MVNDVEYLNAQQAAEYLGVTTQRIYQLAVGRRIGKQIAGFWVFTKAELDAFQTQPKSKGGRPKAEAGTLTAVSPA